MFVDDFAEPEPRELATEHERPVWLGPPIGELGVAVPLGAVLGRTQRGFVAVSHALVYSSGVSFDLVAHVGGLKPSETNSLFHDQHAGRVGVEELPDGFLRFGIEQSDGARVSNLGGHRRFAQPEEAPRGPVLFQNGGGGGQSSGTSISWSLSYWFWPLPPNGPLRLFTEWPVAEIPLAHTEIAADSIVEAASQAKQLSSDDTTHGGWTSTVGQYVMRTGRTATSPSEDADDETVTLPIGQLHELENALRNALAALRRART